MSHTCVHCTQYGASSYDTRLITSITMATMYGYQVTSMDDPMIAAADRNMAMGGSLLQPGPSLLNIFPFLGYIPPSLAGPFKSRKIAGETLRLSRYIQSSLKDFVEKAIVSLLASTSIGGAHVKQNTRTMEQLSPLLLQTSWRSLGRPKYLK